MYLLTYRGGIIVDTLIRMFKICDSELTRYPVYSMTDKESVGFVIKECLIAILKVLINLTHDFNNQCKSSGFVSYQYVFAILASTLIFLHHFVPPASLNLLSETCTKFNQTSFNHDLFQFLLSVYLKTFLSSINFKITPSPEALFFSYFTNHTQFYNVFFFSFLISGFPKLIQKT